MENNTVPQNVKFNIDHKTLIEFMETQPNGFILTHDKIQEMCIKKDQISVMSSVQTAIRKLRNNGIVWHNIRGIGYKRANSHEIVKKSPVFINGARRKLAIGSKEIDVVDDSELTNEEKIKKNTSSAVIGIMQHISKPKQRKLIEQKVTDGVINFNPMENLKYLVHS